MNLINLYTIDINLNIININRREKMEFSIIIPYYNNEFTIDRALMSCINQTYKFYEIIIIDDNSSLQSKNELDAIIKRYIDRASIQLIHNDRNYGPSKSRNVGWDNARGEYIAFLDADDYWRPDRLESAFNILKSLGFPKCCLGQAASNNPNVTRNCSDLERIKYYCLLVRNFAPTPSIIVRRDIEFRFDENMRYAEDHDLWARIARKYKVYKNSSIVSYIDHEVSKGKGLSSNLWKMRRGEIYLYKKNVNKIFYPFFLMLSIAKYIYKSFLNVIRNSL